MSRKHVYEGPTRNVIMTRLRDLERYVEHLNREIAALKSAIADLKSESAHRRYHGSIWGDPEAKVLLCGR